ncbi:hypothetical protein GCM10023200_39270 [Actinomycetospora chlora]|uniref:DUF3566 domain-containing protein n=1 Tax=Actinomycetospora chlora TaxID=663608 RepID=A0ABP9BPU4_9PSEU
MDDDEVGPPPKERAPAAVRRWWRSQGHREAFGVWIIRTAAPLLIAFALLYVAGGLFLGWAAAFDVTTGIKSPSEASFPPLAYPLAVAGWLFAPGLSGAVAGYIVTNAISTRRKRSLTKIFPDRDSE